MLKLTWSIVCGSVEWRNGSWLILNLPFLWRLYCLDKYTDVTECADDQTTKNQNFNLADLILELQFLLCLTISVTERRDTTADKWTRPRWTIPDQSPIPVRSIPRLNLVNISLQISFLSGNKTKHLINIVFEICHKYQDKPGTIQNVFSKMFLPK